MKLEELEKDLELLKKNDEFFQQHPERKAKCMAKYHELRGKICRELSAAIPSFLFSGLKFDHDRKTVEAVMSAIREIVETEKRNGLMDRIRDTALQTYSLDSVVDQEIAPIHDKIIGDVYGDYWISRCQPMQDKEYAYFNSIIGMYYSRSTQSWVKTENGRLSFTIAFPPTKEEMCRLYPPSNNQKSKAVV